MTIIKLIDLVNEASNGIDNFKEGAVGYNGYGFVFKDFKSNIPYITSKGSSKVFNAGSQRDSIENYKKFGDYNINIESDLLLIGSVKTLVPSIDFGGYEQLFEVWVFVNTPEKRKFPIRFYYGQSGLSIGGWNPIYNYIDSYTGKKVFPQKFEKIINFSPFNFSNFERDLFLDALELALKKVPVSDFRGIFRHDLGSTLMGILKGKPKVRDSDKIDNKALNKSRNHTFHITGKDINL
jgi:hypothetical protein